MKYKSQNFIMPALEDEDIQIEDIEKFHIGHEVFIIRQDGAGRLGTIQKINRTGITCLSPNKEKFNVPLTDIKGIVNNEVIQEDLDVIKEITDDILKYNEEWPEAKQPDIVYLDCIRWNLMDQQFRSLLKKDVFECGSRLRIHEEEKNIFLILENDKFKHAIMLNVLPTVQPTLLLAFVNKDLTFEYGTYLRKKKLADLGYLEEHDGSEGEDDGKQFH